MIGTSGFLQRWLGRPASVAQEAPVGRRPPLLLEGKVAEGEQRQPPSPFGQFGEKGESVGEHISYFLARLDDVYALRQEFALVAGPMQDFIRSHDEGQRRLAETVALLSRERTGATAARGENLELRTAQANLEDALAQANNQLKVQGATAEQRGEQLRMLQITHDDVVSRLEWSTRQLDLDAQLARDQDDTVRALTENVNNLEREFVSERARFADLKDAFETSTAEGKRLQAQVDRLQPGLTGAKRRISELESDAAAVLATNGILELKLTNEQEARRAAEAARSQDNVSHEAEAADLQTRIEGLEGRQQVTSRLFDQSRALLNEKIDEIRLVDRSMKELTSEKVTLERRHASAQDEIRRLLEQIGDIGVRNNDAQERCSMLTAALAAKDAQIDQLQARAAAGKSQLDDATARYEQERVSVETINRKLIEEVQSERAERALAQGALSIARGSREKLLAQLEELKRGRYGRYAEASAIESRDPPHEGESGNITRLRAPDLGNSGL